MQQKGFSTILGILLGLVVIGAGTYYFISNDNPQDVLEEKIINTNEKKVSEEVADKSRDETIVQDTTKQENTEEYNRLSKILQTNDMFEYSELYVTKYDSDVYILSTFSFENEYSGNVYHIDLINDDITKIDSPYIYRENEKMYGLKMYGVDYKISIDGQNEQYALDETRLEEIANEIGIEKDKLTISSFGGKPSYSVLVSTEYNPVTKEVKLLPNKKPEYPNYDFTKKSFVLNENKYPNSSFVLLGTLINMNGEYKEALGLKFNYNLGTKKLSIQ